MEPISKAKCTATLLIQGFDLDITLNQMAQVALLHSIILHCPTQTIQVVGLICKPESLQRSPDESVFSSVPEKEAVQ